jgi:hypothetical protein
VSICPRCQAENEAGAAVCRACGKPLGAATPSEGLPPWLQALNPEGRAADTVVAEAHAPADGDKATAADDLAEATETASAQPPPTVREREADTVVLEGNAAARTVPAPAAAVGEAEATTPAFARSTAGASGTDAVIATQPTAAASPRGAAPMTAPAAANNETASLINEDDLPAWLRAFSEPEQTSTPVLDDDQSWMLGSTATIGEEREASDLARSWQAPPRPTAAEPTTPPPSVTRHERLIAPSVPPPQPAPAPIAAPIAAPLAKAAPLVGTPVRLGAGRPIPAIPERATSTTRRIAIVAFLAALLIFLVVLGIFVVAPALRG